MIRRYEQDYRRYVYKKPKNYWAETEEVKQSLEYTDFKNNTKHMNGGMPVISNGKTSWIDTDDMHTVIYGLSGAKKTLCFFEPLIYTDTKCGKSMVINDPKGEIYERMSGFQKAEGYSIYCLDFRTFDADGFNILAYPARLFKSGRKDEGARMLTNLVNVLAEKQRKVTKDVFWPDQAAQWNTGTGILMFEGYPEEQINILNWTDFNNKESADYVETILPFLNDAKAEKKQLKETVGAAENTTRSILVTGSSLMAPLKQNNEMMRMLSHSTFNLDDLLKEKVALYIITDDTTSTCNEVIGIIVSQIQTFLVGEAYKMPGKRLKYKFDFILDEFQSYFVPDMEQALAAHRSRGIRYYLCVQTLAGLKDRYDQPEALLANCGNIFFLGSTEQELLKKISELCGETNITPSGNSRPLISASQLSSLKKTWDYKRALYISPLKSIIYCVDFPSIEAYDLGNYPVYTRKIEHPELQSYTVKEFCEELKEAVKMMIFARTTDIRVAMRKNNKTIRPSMVAFLESDLFKATRE